jgi:transcriptional regulator with XRE-family HTH domain
LDEAESPSVQAPRVGREMRRWRLERGLTLSQVSARSGLNIGYLSTIENDKASPSLAALAAIAAVLEVPAAWLILEDVQAPRVVRKNQRPITETGGGAHAEEVDGGIDVDIRICEAIAPRGERLGRHAHTGFEHHVVLSGTWLMTQGQHVVELRPGDYLTWDATVPHAAESIGKEPGRILVVYARRDP